MKAPKIRAPTGGMGKRGLRFLGILILVINLGLLFVFGFDVLTDPSRFAQIAIGVLGGVLLVASTLELPWNVEGYRLAGVGYLCVASSYLLANLFDQADPWWIAITAVGALSLGFMGFDIARGGRHFNIDLDA